MKEIYRPEIDGLRAISVLLIILYHAQLTILGYQPFKNGFIGIDIFFVISGYLITRILLKELIKTDNLLFINFYLKRIRRIIPALLFVILLSLPFAYILLLPTSFIDYSKSVISALTFSSNFYFFYSGQKYGAEDGVLKPFLHTWSLSVEEQYYILFPIFLYIIFKYFRKYILIILIVVFTASILIADFGSKNYISATFYFLHTRIYELIAGSLVFFIRN
jgi:peptidoglycan/LPS O-acetylase OafA/YrhL